MITKIIEAVQDKDAAANWSKFMVMRPSEEWQRNALNITGDERLGKMARDKRRAKHCEYILIGGFSTEEAGHVKPTITLNRGNGYGERAIETLQTFPVGSAYKQVQARAKELAEERKVTLGRGFTTDEWLGPEFGR